MHMLNIFRNKPIDPMQFCYGGPTDAWLRNSDLEHLFVTSKL